MTATIELQMIFGVSVARRPNQNQQDSRTTSLGDLLYANGVGFRLSETDWVRLVRCTAEGDQLALHSLYERSHRIVFTLIMRITNNRETAEELTLDVFHNVWRKASDYDPANGSVIGWIMNQARSRAIDRLRFEQRKKRTNSYLENPFPSTVADDPHQVYQIQEQNTLLRAALEILTPAERQAIETAFFSELSYEQVATRLDQPVGTVKTRIRSGLAKLRQILGRTSKQ